MLRFILFACAFAFSLGSAFAQKKPKRVPKKTQSARAKALSPEEQQKTFKLPEGFVIELVASEENGLINPIDLAFDDAGRLWTQTAEMYPLDPNSKLVGMKSLNAVDNGTIGQQGEFKRVRDLYQLKTRGTDKVLVIPNPTKQVEGDIHVFADGMALPQSILPYRGGVFVAHGSEMLYLKDENGDRKMDGHETVLTGFGYTDTHTMSHNLLRGPGGWVHFSHGALNKGKVTAPKSGKAVSINYSKIARFSLDGNDLEVVNYGLNNIWGFHMKSNGQWYGTEANDLGWSLVPMHPMMGYKGIGNEKMRPYQPIAPIFHKFKVNGTGISGLAYDENGSRGFPAKWKDVAFLANPITSTINCVIADRKPDGSVISKHLPDFLACEDDWFRPVNIEFGPDGCLYIVDWYNKIVSHNEVSRDHPDRDKSHGRLWRVRHVSQKPAPIPNLEKASDADLLKHLAAEILWEKRSAWQQIADRQAADLIPQLSDLAQNVSQTLETRILALWSLESLGAYDLDLMKVLLRDPSADLRREVIRSLNTFRPGIHDVVTLTKPFLNDPHFMVREQVLRTLGAVGIANSETIAMLVSAATPETSRNNEWSGGYLKNFQRFLALMALEKYPGELRTFLDSPAAQGVASANLSVAAQVLPKGERAEKLLGAIKSGKAKLDANTLIALSESMNDPKVLKALDADLSTPAFVQLALDTQPRLRSNSLQKALAPGLKRLINSSSEEDRSLALQAATRFQNPSINVEVLRMAKQSKDMSPPVFDAVAMFPKQNQAALKLIAADEAVNTSTRVRSILALALADPKAASSLFDSLYSQGDDSLKSELVITAGRSQQGGKLLLGLIQSKKLAAADLDRPTIERMIESHRSHPAARVLSRVVGKLRAEENSAADARLEEYVTATKTLKGDPQTGEAVFATCLACHQVGDKGHDLAPALDGSSNRDVEHLLTAIVKPNDAMEGGYRLYRVTKTNGDILDGYMHSSDGNGTTLAFMGGGKIFIPKEQIQRERFVAGQSFMPASFGMFPAQTMADLVSYIKTIK